MALLNIDADNALYYEHTAPARSGAVTFVFVNALTGNTEAWEAAVAPRLRERGFGTLSYDFRGQNRSRHDPALELTPSLIVDDLRRILTELAPQRPVLVGLSIGGIFAAHAVLAGANATGLVLLNTLREIGPRIGWINDAMPKLVAAGGVTLLMDALLPLLVNQEFAAAARPAALAGDYRPLDAAHPHLNLMRNAAATDWDIEYEALRLPTLVISGLEDRVFLDREVVDRLYARLPDARREDWPDAGHLLPQERPQKLAASLAAFGTALEEGAR